VRFTLERLARAHPHGEARRCAACRPRSTPSARRGALAIRSCRSTRSTVIDLTIDGADEIDARFDMIKGRRRRAAAREGRGLADDGAS
jgi:ribose 5-phosphate isomerase